MRDQDQKHENFFRDVLIFFVVGIAVLLCAAWLTSCKPKDTTYQESAITTANKAQIDSLSREVVIRDSIILGLQNANVASEKKQSDISKSFKPVYDKIKADTGFITQYNYTTVLLAEHSKRPLKRN